MLPALLRYVDLYERRQSSNNSNNSVISKSGSGTVADKDKGCSSSSSTVKKPNTASSSILKDKEKEKEKGGVLVALVTGSTGRGETNHAVNCLLELFERCKRRPVPDSGVPLPPPPLLLQTLLWLLIRCEDGEKELVRVLQPYCEKAMKGGSEEDRQREREREGVPAAPSLSLSRPSSMPDVDLDFLLRECHR
jgi:hypothetical protein